MASNATPLLLPNLPRGLPVLAVLLPLLTALFLAPALRQLPPAQIPDLALRLAVLLTLPLPLLVLQLLTTPPLLGTRRLLGEPATQVMRSSLREVALWTGLLLTAPLALALVGLARQAPVLMHVAAVLAGVVPLTAGLAVAAMLHGLRLMARGRHAAWTAVSGGGAFGPAESAPLLYLPAFALVGALVPVAFLAAVWNARPEWLTPTVWSLLPVVGLLLGLRAAVTGWRHTRAHLHAGLRAVEQAHATRFAQADGLAEPPIWLTLGKPTESQKFLARSWHRRWPLAGIATVALAVVALLLVRTDPPRWSVVLTAAGLTGAAQLRVLALRAEPAWQAGQWLGETAERQRAVLLRLALGLALPSASLTILLAWRGLGAAAALGQCLGAGVATALVRTGRSSASWARGAWLIFAVGLAAAATGGL